MLQGYTKIQIYSIKDFTGPIHRIFYKKKKNLTQFFYSLTDFRNIDSKRIVLTCSRPLYIQISNLK